ncbi:uncharacterized protein LOC134813571 [Bolinopsis microptera]|uniref:uncharacterized protein LOC134813571 n=1 Tax=Bolinopsis microptera TaxID=2820187 RepID=UPI0030791E30
MATSALHVTFLWEASKPSERMIEQYHEIETELSLAVDDADLFNSEVGEDILNAMTMYDLLPQADGSMTKNRMENAICFCDAMAEVYLTVPVERQPTLTDTLYKTGVTDAILSIMRADYPTLKPDDMYLFSALQMCSATLIVSLGTKRAENDITRTDYSHQRLCRQIIPVLQHIVYNSPCLATVLVMLKYLLVLGSTHKPFFNEILGEFHGVLEEFLKPGVLITHWNSRIPARQIELLKSLTPYMPGEVNCFVNILSWFIYEIPSRGMIESDLDKIMEKESLLEIYWKILNEPIPSTYFRYAKSKVMLFYSSLCEEGPQYSNKLIEKFGVCGFLDKILQDVQIDQRCYFPLSCLAKNMIICMNPLHKDNLYPMDKAVELIYEDYGKDDGLVQTEVLQYMPGMKKSMQIKVGKLLTEFAFELRNAFMSEFAITNERKKVKKTKSFKAVRFSGSDQIDDVMDLKPEDEKSTKSPKKSKKQKRKQKLKEEQELEKANAEAEIEKVEAEKEKAALEKQHSEGILTNAVEIKHTTLQGYLENLYGEEYTLYLPTFAQNGLYLTTKRKIFYNCLEEVDRELMSAVCTVCNAALNKIQCKACSFKYCSPECLNKDTNDHTTYCDLKILERSLHEAVVS